MNLDNLYGISSGDITTLKTKVNNLANIAAKTNLKNTFEAPQAIKGTTCFVEFRDNNNNRKGWVGKGSDASEDISVNAETNSLYLTANNHVVVRPGNNYQFLYERTNFSNQSEVVNKRYVDDQNKYVRIISQRSGGR